VRGLAVLAAATACAFAGAARVESTAPPPPEIRGLWVLRTSLASPAAIDAVIGDAVRGGFNTLLVQVRGRGDAFYASRIEPRASELAAQPAGFDPLARTIDSAHRAGLAVHAWVNVNLVASAVTMPGEPSHVVRRHPDWVMVPDAVAAEVAAVPHTSAKYIETIARWTRGAPAQVEGLYLSPATAESRAYTTDVVRELVATYALDGLHLDYIRYPAPGFDYGRTTVAEFRRTRLETVARDERDRLDSLADSDPAAWPAAFPEAWTQFRRDRVTDLVRALQHAARAARPGIVVSAAVVPLPDEAREARMQDWPSWTREGLLDAVCPMLYTTDAAAFSTSLARARDAAAPAPIWTGIGAWRLPLDATLDRMRLARRSGSAGILLFRYDALTATGEQAGRLWSDLRTVWNETDRPGGGR
jgi:uncharacterized lipoprotein YddW (UPF0748 family)